jgi:orotidine-5'-phosphate decarboxylase
MLEAAVKGCGEKTVVLGVTVLTSVSKEEIRSAGFQEQFAQNMQMLVLKRAVMAKNAGCKGVVCSGHEAGVIKKELGREFLVITPGIRPKWEISDKDDQQRVMTPIQAIQNGADYLVIGRPIRDAGDPVKAAEKVALEIREAL